MTSHSTSVGEIVGVVIVVSVFLLLGIFVCGCGPLPKPTEIAQAEWRRKKRREEMMAERRRELEDQQAHRLPLYGPPSRPRVIAFAGDNIASSKQPDPAVHVTLPSPPPPAVMPRNRSPTPQVFSPPGIAEDQSSTTSISLRTFSSTVSDGVTTVEDEDEDEDEASRRDSIGTRDESHQDSTMIAGDETQTPIRSTPLTKD